MSWQAKIPALAACLASFLVAIDLEIDQHVVHTMLTGVGALVAAAGFVWGWVKRPDGS